MRKRHDVSIAAKNKCRDREKEREKAQNGSAVVCLSHVACWMFEASRKVFAHVVAASTEGCMSKVVFVHEYLPVCGQLLLEETWKKRHSSRTMYDTPCQ